ncbi:MAG: sugar phosphate nucleotidyltransferase [archaeon]
MTAIMKAVILAAGEGNRLEPLTANRPKPMIPVANEPVLEYVVEAVADAGIDEIVLVVGYERSRIQNHFGDGDDWDVAIEYAIQEKQLGTAHALLQARPHVDEPFLVLNGDRIIDPSAVEGVAAAFDDDTDAVATVTSVDIPTRYGVVDLEGDRVLGIREKPPAHEASTNLINAGVYAFRPGVFDRLGRTVAGTHDETGLPSTLNDLATAGTVRGVRYDGRWLDLSYPWDLPFLNGRLLDDRDSPDLEGAHVSEDANVSANVSIARGSRVRPFATIGRGVALAENVTVGAGAVVSNAVVLADATIGPGAVIEDAVIGQNARVGANATIAGGRGDVVLEGTYHEDVRLGGVVGDNASLGADVTLVPATIVGTDATVESGLTLDRRVPPGTEVRRG